MAFEMSYTDERGVTYAQSYWRLAVLDRVSAVDGHAQFTFYGFRDKEARASGFDPIGHRTYHVSGAEFAALLNKVLTMEENIVALAYRVAKETKDIPVGPPPDDPFDEDKRARVSFFEDATDV